MGGWKYLGVGGGAIIQTKCFALQAYKVQYRPSAHTLAERYVQSIKSSSCSRIVLRSPLSILYRTQAQAQAHHPHRQLAWGSTGMTCPRMTLGVSVTRACCAVRRFITWIGILSMSVCNEHVMKSVRGCGVARWYDATPVHSSFGCYPKSC